MALSRILAVLATVWAMCGAMPAPEPWVVADGSLVDEEAGRSLAEKRKSCNGTNLPGDFRYEVRAPASPSAPAAHTRASLLPDHSTAPLLQACGEFCKEQKATNHCRYCKCASCAFCKDSVATMASTLHANKGAKRLKRQGARDAEPAEPMQEAAGAGKRRLRGKGLGKKRRGEPPL
jgi:hypothetical protein